MFLGRGPLLRTRDFPRLDYFHTSCMSPREDSTQNIVHLFCHTAQATGLSPGAFVSYGVRDFCSVSGHGVLSDAGLTLQ
jgi:hypothetical protein